MESAGGATSGGQGRGRSAADLIVEDRSIHRFAIALGDRGEFEGVATAEELFKFARSVVAGARLVAARARALGIVAKDLARETDRKDAARNAR